ncbi:Peptidyl-tRNA hydrolase [uncultured Gammaproteobacteria bacterium]
MLLLVGLGNPGAEYLGNRHNLGFMTVEAIAHRQAFGPWRKKFQGVVAEGTVAEAKVLALLPGTYMNLSGQAVNAAAGFHKIGLENVVVFHDDLDLPPGKIRIKRGGGHGGHNGLRSIDAHLGRDYWRVRMGIGHPGDKTLVHDYVLHDFAKSDREWLEPLLDACAAAFPLLAQAQPENFMNKVALATRPAKSSATGDSPATPKPGPKPGR